MVETKYALKTAVKTTVVYPEFAKSKHAQAKTSDGFTPDLKRLAFAFIVDDVLVSKKNFKLMQVI